MINPSDLCGCCEGTEAITPQPTANRPGLAALAYRAGTHAAFLETMKARLSSRDYPALGGLTTRASNDPSIALLDAWATVADVLTFYQERIANEGYLRTATERRSVLELARLVGYALRPGVAASAWLALELDKGYTVALQPHEIKSQSVPGPGEMPQVFENVEPLEARHAWNRLQPRLSQPQTLNTITQGTGLNPAQPRVYVKGTSANLKPNDVVLITASGQPLQPYHVAEVKPDPANDRTLVIFQKEVMRVAPAGESFDVSTIAAVAESYIAGKPKTGRSTARTEMAQRVIVHLKTLSGLTAETGTTAESAEQVVRERLAKIAEEQSVAVGEQYKNLAAWLTDMTKKLNEAAQGLRMAAAREKALVVAASPPGAPPRVSQLRQPNDDDPLKKPMISLTKRASVPPRNAPSLVRDIARTFNAQADIGLQMAGTFDTKLRQTLPGTLANAKVTLDSTIKVYALRLKASLFGHNAPKEPQYEPQEIEEVLI